MLKNVGMERRGVLSWYISHVNQGRCVVEETEPRWKEFGDYLRSLRESRGMSQAGLAQRIEYSEYASLAAWEQGRRLPPAEVLPQIQGALALTPDEFGRLLRLAGLYPGSVGFDALVEQHKSHIIAAYPGLGWGTALSLRECPAITQGWRMADVRIKHSEGDWFQMPEEYRTRFERYYKQFYTEKRFADDREKFQVIRKPVAISDTPTLILETRSCRFSQVCFYRDEIAMDRVVRDPLIEQVVRGSGQANFPHVFALQLVVVTSDGKALIVKRPEDMAFMPGLWSCTIEEQLDRKDFEDGGQDAAILNLGKRILREEMSLDDAAYDTDDLRLLSVALESDTLTMVICGYVKLHFNQAQLERWLHGIPKEDLEFTAWEFLDVSRPREVLLAEARGSRRYSYHPTAGYRMVLMFMHRFGRPTQSDGFRCVTCPEVSAHTTAAVHNPPITPSIFHAMLGV